MKAENLKHLLPDEPASNAPDELLQAVRDLAKPNEALIAAIKESSNNTMRVVAANTLAVIKMKPEPAKPAPAGWTFTFVRNTDGFIDKIIARPT